MYFNIRRSLLLVLLVLIVDAFLQQSSPFGTALADHQDGSSFREKLHRCGHEDSVGQLYKRYPQFKRAYERNQVLYNYF